MRETETSRRRMGLKTKILLTLLALLIAGGAILAAFWSLSPTTTPTWAGLKTRWISTAGRSPLPPRALSSPMTASSRPAWI